LHYSAGQNDLWLLWNPSTGIHKRIPLIPIDDEGKSFRYLCGFGYDQSRDDYLLVSMSYDNFSDNISSHFEFFSLSDNTWKEIEDNHFPYMDRNNWDDPMGGALFNGAIHWLAFRHDISMNVIVAFDLMEKKLLNMHLPNDFRCQPYDGDLWVFGDFLSLWGMADDALEIWVMKEYKVNSSWTKTLVLPIDGIPIRFFSPLCCTKSGDIVGRDSRTGLMKYDNKRQLLEHHSYCNDQSGSQMIMYTESLFSPLTFLSEPKKLTQTIRTKRRSTRRRMRL
jgi:F-box interacting protein